MELGIGMFGDVAIDPKTGKYRDAGIKLREILEQVKLMDEVGIDVFAMGEHHRADDETGDGTTKPPEEQTGSGHHQNQRHGPGGCARCGAALPLGLVCASASGIDVSYFLLYK